MTLTTSTSDAFVTPLLTSSREGREGSIAFPVANCVSSASAKRQPTFWRTTYCSRVSHATRAANVLTQRRSASTDTVLRLSAFPCQPSQVSWTNRRVNRVVIDTDERRKMVYALIGEAKRLHPERVTEDVLTMLLEVLELRFRTASCAGYVDPFQSIVVMLRHIGLFLPEVPEEGLISGLMEIMFLWSTPGQ